jgi:SAM-dependent methyltransferase
VPASSKYDRIGTTYASTRSPDPRIAARIDTALGDAASVVNVGAGTGSYEDGRTRWAVEPSAVMISQRPAGAAPVVQADAEALPLPDDCVDAATAFLTIHHWTDVAAGVAELRRVARRRVVVWTFDPDVTAGFWLIRDYVPAAAALDSETAVPVDRLVGLLGGATSVEALPVPWDCVDGFAGAFWRRPERYLDPRVRAGISVLAELAPAEVEAGMARLAADVESGAWADRYSGLLEIDELDVGMRLVVTDLLPD